MSDLLLLFHFVVFISMTTFKAIYQWQCQLYKKLEQSQIEEKKNIEKDISYDDVRLDDESRYVVLKSYHPNQDDIWIISVDDKKGYFVPCKPQHIESLLVLIQSYGPKGATLIELCENLHISDDDLLLEIALNIEDIVTHLLSVKMLHKIVTPKSTNFSQDSLRYRIKGFGNCLDNFGKERDNSKFQEVLDTTKSLILPKGCQEEHIEGILSYAYLCTEYGICIADLKCDLMNEHIQTYLDISNNAEKWVDYLVKTGILMIVEA